MKRKERRRLLLLIDDLKAAQAEYEACRAPRDPVDRLHLTVTDVISQIQAMMRGELE